jgi:hypothetical protein
MKSCPKCKQSYEDNQLYFCLNDGEMLVAANSQAAPTIFMDASRSTNEIWQGTPQNTSYQNQQISPNQQFNPPMMVIGHNQTLPTISLILGIVSLLISCCYMGIPLGPIAIILGYLGIRNINSDPQKYGGNSLAIGGIVCGIVGLLVSIGLLLIVISTPTK